MRMWMVDPALLCDQHLLGEHVELHMLVGSLKRHRSIEGYIAGGLLEPRSLEERHRALVAEMLRRGFSHRSPLPEADIEYLPPASRGATVDREKAAAELAARCQRCGDRICAAAARQAVDGG